MGYGNPIVHELLSAFLDNELDAAQIQEVEQLLASDKQLAEYLVQIRANREALLASRSSVAKVDFVSRVLASIQTQSPTTLEVVPSELRPELRHPEPKPKLRFVWAALAGLAALVVLSILIPQPKEPQGLVSQQPNEADGSHERSPFDLARNEDLLDSTLPAESGVASKSGSPVPVIGSESRTQAMDELRQSMQPKFNIHMLMVLDVMVANEAWKSNQFSKVLDEIGVPIVSPIVVGPEISALLEDNRVFRSDEASGVLDRDSGTARAALVYIQANGVIVDRLINKMSANKRDFPEVRIDLAFDPADQLLAKILGSQKNQPVDGPSARILVTAQDALLESQMPPQFSPGPRRKRFAPSATRIPEADNSNSNAILGEMNPAADILIVLRKPE